MTKFWKHLSICQLGCYRLLGRTNKSRPSSVSIGYNAGKFYQGTGSIAIENDAGITGTGSYSVAIGNNALNGGFTGSVALGYNSLNTANNQIMLGTSFENVVFPGKIQPSTTVAPTSLVS